MFWVTTLIFQGHVTSSVTRPIDSQYVVLYRCSIDTDLLSGTVFVILSFKHTYFCYNLVARESEAHHDIVMSKNLVFKKCWEFPPFRWAFVLEQTERLHQYSFCWMPRKKDIVVSSIGIHRILVVGLLLTGHMDLNQHLYIMGVRYASCPLCQEDEDTTLHFIAQSSSSSLSQSQRGP